VTFTPTAKQNEAWSLMSGPAKHVLLVGGSRSGKTFVACRGVAMRALLAPKSRHAILRYRFNHVKTSVVLDTWPKMMGLCFPEIKADLNKTDWYCEFPNGSQVWFGGLDDKDRTEKILGNEYATMFFNEISQIALSSKDMALTRLAQLCDVPSLGKPMRLKAIYDCNPPSQAHWSYQQLVRGVDPNDKKPLRNREDYQWMRLNPTDNITNLPAEYITSLEAMPVRMRQRFLEGLFADVTDGALWNVETIDANRETNGNLPDMQRVVVAVDPSGSGDADNTDNDAIGIVVVGLGIDGRGYVLEDCTCKCGPATWGNVVATAYDRHAADLIVAEKNYGGEMVRRVLQVAAPVAKIELVTASRGKVVRAEPISALTEQGKIRFAGYFPELEDELCGMTTNGYIGENSPNRADAFVWGASKLFPGIIRNSDKQRPKPQSNYNHYQPTGWLAA